MLNFSFRQLDFKKLDAIDKEIKSKFWTEDSVWLQAGGYSWSAEDDLEDFLERTFKTVSLEPAEAEVHVEVSFHGSTQRHQVYRVRKMGGDWRICDYYELEVVSEEAPENVGPLEVTHVSTEERPLAPNKVSKWLLDRALPAWRLHALRDNDVTASESHLGGPFAANDPAQWPRCAQHRTANVGVLQLWKRDVVSATTSDTDDFFHRKRMEDDAVERMFPQGKDLLQVFWCPFDHTNDSDFVLRWRDSSEVDLSNRSNPETLRPAHGGRIPRPCRLFPERVQDYPSVNRSDLVGDDAVWDEILGNEVLQTFARVIRKGERPVPVSSLSSVNRERLTDACREHLGSFPCTKLGGHPDWIQDVDIPVCACGTEMEHLLSISSSFDPTQNSCPVTVSPSRAHFDWDTDLMLGHSGYVYFFVCRSCPGMTSVKSVCQCC